jgi:hypothetical protein
VENEPYLYRLLFDEKTEDQVLKTMKYFFLHCCLLKFEF